VKPLPAALVCGSLLVLAVASDHPFVLAATAMVSLALLLAASPPHGPYIWFALVAGGMVALLNPFVAVQGLTTLWHGPDIPVLDTEITVEELAYGGAAALRIVGSALAVGAFVRLVDADMLARAIGRVAPRSAMIGALGARLLPTLERDAAGIVLAARGRGVALGRRRASAELVAPLVSLSLERSLALAEAMEARGYGAGPRTCRPQRRWDGREIVLLVAGAALAGTAVAVVAGAAAYRYYDLLGDPVTTAGIAVAAIVAVAGAVAVGAVRWPR
jgi:energy-coupling factor transport system permease protein